MKEDTLQRFLGREFPVLVEGRENGAGLEGEFWGGYTPNFLRVALPYAADTALDNRIVPVKLKSITDNSGSLLGNVL